MDYNTLVAVLAASSDPATPAEARREGEILIRSVLDGPASQTCPLAGNLLNSERSGTLEKFFALRLLKEVTSRRIKTQKERQRGATTTTTVDESPSTEELTTSLLDLIARYRRDGIRSTGRVWGPLDSVPLQKSCSALLAVLLFCQGIPPSPEQVYKLLTSVVTAAAVFRPTTDGGVAGGQIAAGAAEQFSQEGSVVFLSLLLDLFSEAADEAGDLKGVDLTHVQRSGLSLALQDSQEFIFEAISQILEKSKHALASLPQEEAATPHATALVEQRGNLLKLCIELFRVIPIVVTVEFVLEKNIDDFLISAMVELPACRHEALQSFGIIALELGRKRTNKKRDIPAMSVPVENLSRFVKNMCYLADNCTVTDAEPEDDTFDLHLVTANGVSDLFENCAEALLTRLPPIEAAALLKSARVLLLHPSSEVACAAFGSFAAFLRRVASTPPSSAKSTGANPWNIGGGSASSAVLPDWIELTLFYSAALLRVLRLSDKQLIAAREFLFSNGAGQEGSWRHFEAFLCQFYLRASGGNPSSRLNIRWTAALDAFAVADEDKTGSVSSSGNLRNMVLLAASAMTIAATPTTVEGVLLAQFKAVGAVVREALICPAFCPYGGEDCLRLLTPTGLISKIPEIRTWYMVPTHVIFEGLAQIFESICLKLPNSATDPPVGVPGIATASDSQSPSPGEATTSAHQHTPPVCAEMPLWIDEACKVLLAFLDLQFVNSSADSPEGFAPCQHSHLLEARRLLLIRKSVKLINVEAQYRSPPMVQRILSFIFDRMFVVTPGATPWKPTEDATVMEKLTEGAHGEPSYEIRRAACLALRVVCHECPKVLGPYVETILSELVKQRESRASQLSELELALLDDASVAAVAAVGRYDFQKSFTERFVEPYVKEFVSDKVLEAANSRERMIAFLFGQAQDRCDERAEDALATRRRAFARTVEQISLTVKSCSVPSDPAASLAGGYENSMPIGSQAGPPRALADPLSISQGFSFSRRHPLDAVVRRVLAPLCRFLGTYHSLWQVSYSGELAWVDPLLQLGADETFPIIGQGLVAAGKGQNDIVEFIEELFPIPRNFNVPAVRLIRRHMTLMRSQMYRFLALLSSAPEAFYGVPDICGLLRVAVWDSIEYLPVSHLETQVKLLWRDLCSPVSIPSLEQFPFPSFLNIFLTQGLVRLGARIEKEFAIAHQNATDSRQVADMQPTVLSRTLSIDSAGKNPVDINTLHAAATSCLASAALSFIESLLYVKQASVIATPAAPSNGGNSPPAKGSASPDSTARKAVDRQKAEKSAVKRAIYHNPQVFTPILEVLLLAANWPDAKASKFAFSRIRTFAKTATKMFVPIPPDTDVVYRKLLQATLSAALSVRVWQPAPPPQADAGGASASMGQQPGRNVVVKSPYVDYRNGTDDESYTMEVVEVVKAILRAQIRVLGTVCASLNTTLDADKITLLPAVCQSFQLFEQLPCPMSTQDCQALVECYLRTSDEIDGKTAKKILFKTIVRNVLPTTAEEVAALPAASSEAVLWRKNRKNAEKALAVEGSDFTAAPFGSLFDFV